MSNDLCYIYSMDTYHTVKSRLLQLMEQRRISIRKLALSSSVPPSTIKNILYGKSANPGIVTIKRLCDGLCVSLPEFFSTDEFCALDEELS